MDELEECRRCEEEFEPRELNDVGLCAGCVKDEASESRCGPECTCRGCQNERRFGDHPFAG
jgi:hypothetical protein